MAEIFRTVSLPGSAFRPVDGATAWTTTGGVLRVAAGTTVQAPFLPPAGESFHSVYSWTDPPGPWFGPGALAPAQLLHPSADGPWVVSVELPAGVGLRSVRIDGIAYPCQRMVLIEPVRLFDSRTEQGYLVVPGARSPGKLATGQSLGFTLMGVTSTAIAGALLNVTLTETEGAGYVLAWGGGGEDPVAPPTSTANWFGPGQTVANLAVCRVGGEATFALASGGNGRTHLVVDVLGYLS